MYTLKDSRNTSTSPIGKDYNSNLKSSGSTTEHIGNASNPNLKDCHFKSEEVRLPLHTTLIDYRGESLRTFTKADISKMSSALNETSKFRSEVNINDIYDKISHLGDSVRDIPTELHSQLANLTNLIKLLNDDTFISCVNFDARRMADITSQIVIAFQLLSANPTMTNITLVFGSVLTKLDLPQETMTKCLTFISDALHHCIAAISTLGYKSEAALDNFVSVLKSIGSTVKGGIDLCHDEVVDIVLGFLAKLVAFWTTVSGGFAEDDFKFENLPKVVEKLREILSQGGDLIEGLLGCFSWVTDNVPKFIKGDFTGFFFGKAEVREFESRVSKIKKVYPLVKAGSTEVLKEQYGLTFISFDAEVAALIKMANKFMKRAKPAQKPALKRYLDELLEVQVDRHLTHSNTQTKVTAYGVCFVGPSGVGKSLLMAQTSKVLISAYGEAPTDDMIVTGQMSDKFDSNEEPHHLSLQYDDVSNNSQNENFDKLLNAVNSQARPFLKAGVDEKGLMFPSNVACVISTNVPGINAKKSNCPDSICRRFLHIQVTIKPECVEEVCVPGTERVDPVKAFSSGTARMDIWDFDVYEFITWHEEYTGKFDDDGEPIPTVIPEDEILWEGMRVRPVEWSEKPRSERTYWDLATYLGNSGKEHFNVQREMLAQHAARQQVDFCMKCCIPQDVCPCEKCVDAEFESEFIIPAVDAGIERLILQYNTFHDGITHWYNVAKVRTMISLALAMAPVSYYHAFYISYAIGLYCVFGWGLSLSTSVLFMMAWIPICMIFVVLYEWRKLYLRVQNRAGILTHLATDSMETMRQYRIHTFAGITMVSFAYLIYKTFRPKSEQVSYRETLPENMKNAFVRATKARTTPLDNIMPHMKRDLGKMIITTSKETATSLTFPVESNCYVVTGHMVPEKGDFEITVVHNSSLTPTVSKQKLNSVHVYRFPNKDLALVQVPSAVPRKGYKDFLLGRDVPLGSRPVHIVTMDLTNDQRYTSTTRMEPGWSMFSKTITTDRVSLHKPYRYACPAGTRDGMCGSLIVDYSKAIIYGFHVAGNGKTGLCNTLTIEDVELGMKHFTGFIPLNQGELPLGSESLEKDLGFITLETGKEFDKPVEEHNCIVEGVHPRGGATFRHPYQKHPFYETVVEKFGEPKYGPPQKLNSDLHKRKALTKLTTPNQEFSLSELQFAADDYVKPILTKISTLSKVDVTELARPLTISESLNGLEDGTMNSIDNNTAVGDPIGGKKKKFLRPDPLDPSIPLAPRELVEYNDISILDEINEMKTRYLSGQSCRALFKCSMKSNELLPLHKFKARVFMGCNFPFLLLARQYLAPFMRLVAKNKLLFETAKGINMDSIEAEELFDYLYVDGGHHIVPLDYAAFDQTMAAQASTQAAGMIVDIIRALGCDDDHVQIVRGLLTDITYPNLNFFGTILQIANSDPSGQPITTDLNGSVNSLYKRVFFYRIYPELKNKVSYRDAVHTVTYGDDNLNAVKNGYEKFNATNIIAVGKECGLTITMADKDAEVTDFVEIWDSDFLKRKFRYCPDLGHIRAPLLKDSIEKSLHWMKYSSPETPEELFAQDVDNMLRKSSQHGLEYFSEIREKLLYIAEKHECVPLCKWWTYDELIKHDRHNYYEHYRGFSLYDVESDEKVLRDFLSESKKMQKRPNILWVLAKTVIVMGGATLLSVEFANWYDGGGREQTIRAIAKKIRQISKKCNDVKSRTLDPLEESYALNGAQGLAEDLGLPLFVVKMLLATMFVSESYTEDTFRSESLVQEAEFKSESLSTPNITTLFSRFISMIMEWLLALFPFVNAGRFTEIGVTPNWYSVLTCCIVGSQYLVNVDSISAFDRSTLTRFGFLLKQQLAKLWLRENNDIIRKQPYCILLEGPPGVGKTTCGLAMVKALIPDIDRSDIIVLNEDDEFQSELRSNHRVIVLDDLNNTADNYLTTSPLRRVIDFVNNTPRRALMPDVELKGIVKIDPELVVITTNRNAQALLKFSNCGDSLVRRWRYFRVLKEGNFAYPFDTSCWRLGSYPMNFAGSTNYLDWNSKVFYARDNGNWQNYQEVIVSLKETYTKHHIEQQSLVDMVNKHFDPPTLYERLRIWWKPKFKSESLIWDHEMLERLMEAKPSPDQFIATMANTKEELLLKFDVLDFDEVPDHTSPLSWWEWLKIQLKLETFRSEGLSDLIPSSFHYNSTEPQKFPREFTEAEKTFLLKNKRELIRRHLILEKDFAIFLDNDRLDVIQFLTTKGPTMVQPFLKLFDELKHSSVDWSTYPNYIDNFDLVAYYKFEEEMVGFVSESLKGGLETPTSVINSYCQVFGDEIISSYLSENNEDVMRFSLAQKDENQSQQTTPILETRDFPDEAFDTPRTDVSCGLLAKFQGDYNNLEKEEPSSEFFVTHYVRSIFGDVIGSGVPSPEEHKAQCLAHAAVNKRFPNSFLIGNELLINGISCDLVYSLGSCILFVEAKAHSPKECCKQAMVRSRHFTGKVKFAYFTPSVGLQVI